MAFKLDHDQIVTIKNSQTFSDDGQPYRQGGNVMDMRPAALVVDDFRTMTEIMCRILQQIGFTDVDRAHDGPSALKQLRTKSYGLVLSDWEMDPMTGPQLIEEMRRDPSISNIPVILVTAKRNQDHSWLAGGDGYIVKPFTAQTLLEKVDEVLASIK